MNAVATAERTFEVDGQNIECRFYRPEPDGQDFRCAYEIDWPEGQRKRRAFGVDAVRALLLAMQAAHTDLLAARENHGRQILWLENRSLGLPVAKAISDWASDNEF